jgi:hypothetical protein
LRAAVEQEPRAIGQPFSVWTCLDLARHLISHGFPAVSAETIRRHLHWLDYRVIRPVLSINSPDPAYRTKAEQLKQYQEQARRGQIILLYEDEIDLHLLPGIIGCWTRRGQQRRVMTPGQNVKRYGFGAVNFRTGRITYRLGERKNSDGFCALLEQVVQEYCAADRDQSRPVVIVVDNFIIHRSRRTQSVLAQYADRLTLFALPTYSPKLNIVELLWKYLRRKVTHNHLFRCIGDVTQAVDDFLASLNSQPELVLSVTGCSE